jgi:hypothetical protein
MKSGRVQCENIQRIHISNVFKYRKVSHINKSVGNPELFQSRINGQREEYPRRNFLAQFKKKKSKPGTGGSHLILATREAEIRSIEV